jgi:hypothetical protein
VAAYLQRRTIREDVIYVWGFDPVIYLLADRPSASRFIYSLPLTSDWAPRSWQSEFMRELEAHPPVYVVAQPGWYDPSSIGSALDSGSGTFFYSYFPALRLWLERNYQPEAAINGYRVLRRRE